jgi:hypothetical protein
MVDLAVNRPGREPRLRESAHPGDTEDGSFPILSGNGHFIAGPHGAQAVEDCGSAVPSNVPGDDGRPECTRCGPSREPASDGRVSWYLHRSIGVEPKVDQPRLDTNPWYRHGHWVRFRQNQPRGLVAKVSLTRCCGRSFAGGVRRAGRRRRHALIIRRRGESWFGGRRFASAAHTSTAPMMASPPAITALRARLRFQLDEPNISLDPLMTAVGTQSFGTACGGDASGFAGAHPLSGGSGSAPRTWNASVQQTGGGDLWLVQPPPVSVSVEAGEGATSNSDGSKDDWRPAIECLLNSYGRAGVTRKRRCLSTFSSHSPPRGPRAFATPTSGQQSGTTSAQSYDGEIRWRARETVVS